MCAKRLSPGDRTSSDTAFERDSCTVIDSLLQSLAHTLLICVLWQGEDVEHVEVKQRRVVLVAQARARMSTESDEIGGDEQAVRISGVDQLTPMDC